MPHRTERREPAAPQTQPRPRAGFLEARAAIERCLDGAPAPRCAVERYARRLWCLTFVALAALAFGNTAARRARLGDLAAELAEGAALFGVAPGDYEAARAAALPGTVAALQEPPGVN